MANLKDDILKLMAHALDSTRCTSECEFIANRVRIVDQGDVCINQLDYMINNLKSHIEVKVNENDRFGDGDIVFVAKMPKEIHHKISEVRLCGTGDRDAAINMVKEHLTLCFIEKLFEPNPKKEDE